jgi:hypothetical protein
MRYLDAFGAVGHLLDGGRDDRKRARDRTGNDQHAEDDHDQRQHAEASQDKCHRMVGVGLFGQPLAAFGVDLGERLEILVQRGAHLAVGVVVAPFTPRRPIDLDTTVNQLLAEVDELFDALLESGELLGVVGLDQRFPVLDHVENTLVEFEQPVAVFLHHRWFRRHVDAARFHHDRIDQRIDALDIERGAAGDRDRFGELSILAGVVVGQGRDSSDEHGDQRDDRIQLGCKRKPGCHGATKMSTGNFSRIGTPEWDPVNAVSVGNVLSFGGECLNARSSRNRN